MKIEYGRADIAALFRPFHAKLKADRRERRQREVSGHPDAPDRKVPDSIVVLTWPIGWNHEGQAVRFEAESVSDVFGQRLTVQAKDERGLIREMRFRVADHLMHYERMEGGAARKRAISVPVIVADRLPRRPSKGEVLGPDGEVVK